VTAGAPVSTEATPAARSQARPLRLEAIAPRRADPDRTMLVLDPTWMPPVGAVNIRSARDIAARILTARDLIADTADHLEHWADGSGVVDLLTVEATSYWQYVRLHHWLWLQQQILWLRILDVALREAAVERIECGPGIEEAARNAALAIGARDGLEVLVEVGPPAPDRHRPAGWKPLPAKPVRRGPRRWLGGALRRMGRFGRRLIAIGKRVQGAPMRTAIRLGLRQTPPTARQLLEQERARRLAALVARLESLSTESGRLLVLQEHADQIIHTDTGPRRMNAYLGPVSDRLAGGPLDPIELHIRARVKEDAGWERFSAPEHQRLLTIDTLRLAPEEAVPEPELDVEVLLARLRPTPVVEAGVDLAPALQARVAETTRTTLPNQLRSRDRIRWLLQRLRPRGILLADEYHRQDWLAAAVAEGIATVAIQHGMIYRFHNGYMHRARPAGLRLPDRTYVFGRWERDLLVEQSVYTPDEVRVGGSPRLDLVRADPADRPRLRAELGVRPEERMIVVSGTWGAIYRSVHYPICLMGVVDRPLPRVHFVVKLHPGEPDEGPYRAVIERAAQHGGFPAPRVTIVQQVDLYRLLAAADAHLGVHSTVLTEAVVTGTPNLLADTLAAADLLGYVEAGVAIPVRDGGDLLRALDVAAAGKAMPEANRAAFLAQHFEPGRASDRIADDLLAWLS
jgi:hypothetical protein